MNILGIYGAIDWDSNLSYDKETNYPTWIHDSGATLIINGKHVCSISEERLTRIKYDGNFPKNSINYCLSAGQIATEEIDLVCFPSMCIEIFFKQLNENLLHNKLISIFPNAKIKILSHHLSHAASSIFSCDFNEGSFLTLDGGGSLVYDPYKSEVIFIEKNSIGYFNKSKKILRYYPTACDVVNNFGNYYRKLSITTYRKKTCKNDHNDPATQESAVGKIMGLSAYGKYEENNWKDYKISSDYDTPFVRFGEQSNIFDYVYNFKSPEDMSAILQKNFESALLDYITALKDKTYLMNNVCFAGGCFLNVLANSLIRKSNLFDKIHIPPYTNDSGLHFGAACYGAFLWGDKIELSENLALVGKEYSGDEILNELEKHKVEYTRYESFTKLCQIIASYLYDNKIIGWFQNRSEFGPRALGARSLLMNPTPAENKDIMNLRVKHREYWRPFAGIILDEHFSEYFEEDFSSDYMLYSFNVRESKINDLRAIAHVDNTCRAQNVNERLNPQITTLLEEYKKISGIPVLLNTSFNDNGQPIVETPKDAISSFMNMDIDYLVIGNYLVSKNKKNKKETLMYN
jgi:carbamoyltransferase